MTTTSDLPLFHPNERVDIRDIDQVSLFGLLDQQRNNASFISASARIISGFTWSGTGTTLTLALGKAIVAELRDAVARQGQILSEGALTKGVSFSGLAALTYGVYVRFIFVDGSEDNRVFWNALSAAEEVQSVFTRKTADWQAQVSTVSPGPDWIKILDVAWDASALSTSTKTDRRVFLFDGPADNSYQPTWGGGNDRNADRASFGVQDFDRFASYVNKKFQDIQGTQRYWEVPTQHLQQKVGKTGDTITGIYFWNGLPGTDKLDFGKWQFGQIVTVEDPSFGQTSLTFQEDSRATPWDGPQAGIGAEGAPFRMRNTSGSNGTINGGPHISWDMEMGGLSDPIGARFDMYRVAATDPSLYIRMYDGTTLKQAMEFRKNMVVSHQNLMPGNVDGGFPIDLADLGDSVSPWDECNFQAVFVYDSITPDGVATAISGANTAPWSSHVARAIRGKTITGYNSGVPANSTDLITLNQNSTILAAGQVTISLGTPSISANRHNATATVTDLGVGDFEINFPAGCGVPDDAAVICTPTTGSGGYVMGVVKSGASGLKLTIKTYDSAGVAADRPFSFICVGRPRTIVTDPIS